MKTNTIALTLALSFLTAARCFAGEPEIGTWKLNEAKSKLAPGTGKNNTVVYDDKMFGKVKVTIDGIDSKGNHTHDEWVGRFDGKDYPVKGDPDSDMRAYTKVNTNTLDFTIKKAGKTMATGRIVIAADGKSRSVTEKGVTAKGKKFKNVAVYDKESSGLRLPGTH